MKCLALIRGLRKENVRTRSSQPSHHTFASNRGLFLAAHRRHACIETLEAHQVDKTHHATTTRTSSVVVLFACSYHSVRLDKLVSRSRRSASLLKRVLSGCCLDARALGVIATGTLSDSAAALVDAVPSTSLRSHRAVMNPLGDCSRIQLPDLAAWKLLSPHPLCRKQVQ